MRNSAIQLRPQGVTNLARRNAVSLRSLVAMVFPAAQPLTVPVAIEPSWQIMLRTQTATPTGTQPAKSTGRKYLWVRRTSRRQYNLHMSRMREHISEINPMPAIAIFSSLVGIAFILSIVVR